MNDSNLKTYQDNFEHLLKQKPPQNYLPNFVEPKSHSSWWEDLWKKIGDWLNSSKDTTVQSPQFDFQNFAFYLKCFLIFCGVLALVYLLIILFRSFKKNHSNQPDQIVSKNSSLESKGQRNVLSDYHLALKSENYALAARLYWKNYLQKMQLPKSTTLEEWKEGNPSLKSENKMDQTGKLIQQSAQLMFGRVSQPEKIFTAWLNWMEKTSRA